MALSKILILKSKHETVYFDATTPELEDQAYRKAFEYNKEFSCYSCFEELDPEDVKDKGFRQQFQLYKKAKEGDVKAIKALLHARKTYEYEWFEIEEVK